MKHLKKIWWVFVIIFIIIVVVIDRNAKIEMEEEYVEFAKEQEKKIELVDSITHQALENHKKVDYIVQTYDNKRDSLERLKMISGENQKRIDELNRQIEVLDGAKDLAIANRDKMRVKYKRYRDSLLNEIKIRDERILQLESKVIEYSKQLSELKMKISEIEKVEAIQLIEETEYELDYSEIKKEKRRKKQE